MLRKYLQYATIAVLAFWTCARSAHADADERSVDVWAERQIGDANVRVVHYLENWGAVLCVEVRDAGLEKPRCVWRCCGIFREAFFNVHSFVLSDAADGRFLFAYCRSKTVYAYLVKLNAEVEPLPSKMQRDPKTGTRNWKDTPPMLIIPKPRPVNPRWSDMVPLGKDELGMDLGFKYKVQLESAAKTASGWRIDARVNEPYDRITERNPDGSFTWGPNPVPTLRFAVLIDEECKSAKVEVVK